jgi:hypothetical protein
MSMAPNHFYSHYTLCLVPSSSLFLLPPSSFFFHPMASTLLFTSSQSSILTETETFPPQTSPKLNASSHVKSLYCKGPSMVERRDVLKDMIGLLGGSITRGYVEYKTGRALITVHPFTRCLGWFYIRMTLVSILALRRY